MAGRYVCKIILIVCWVVCCIDVDAASVTNNKEKIIFILTDGLRWDRFGQDLPNFIKMEQNGVKADWLNGVFMTMTIPSTFSIATGLYPESHGAIHNLFFNATSGEKSPSFMATMNYTEWFDAGAEPIWVTTISQGGKAGTILYTGSNVPIKGVEPTKNIPIDLSGSCFSLPMNERIDNALSWITSQDFDIVVIYFNLPDFNLHSYGTEDQRTFDTLYEVDDAIGYLFQRLEEDDLTDTVNVIIASDHGHINSEVGKHVLLYDYINVTDVDFIIADYGPCFQLNAVDGKLDQVYMALKNAHPALTVYKKDELPERYHYGNNERVLDIFGCVDPGWHLHTAIQGNDTFLISDHGYDNQWMVMKSSFYAQGPHFKKNYRAEPFESVDIYSMMCEILSLDPAPNNGSRERYADMFASDAANLMVPTRVQISLLLIFVMAIFM
ncbi:ectonucleotide pyrophosphatase/phosphodiesterase family member 7-like [Lytechinus variegatus]|uniref:ectonucleotide pyrophosphatase/phosphodiesterase family member 7-like n=1 Tax=Lytechinus variegatus TaxID=7654 RepID=UPI001BB2A010|nr:ectonucleotide pyrophosphatase/phosphodiesterase family member 7-like [Lytechinus variegatus]